MKRSKCAIWLLSTLSGITPVLAGPSVIEPPWPPGPDAGGTTSSAQGADGTGPLWVIAGELSGSTSIASAFTDFEDMFKIRICDQKRFSAQASADFDTQLWLFDESGMGLLGNNDASGADDQAFIFPPANDGTNMTVPKPGVYFLAISGLGNVPQAEGLDIFEISSETERSGPDGDGGSGALTGWSGEGEFGPYLIFLQGAALLDDDCLGESYVSGPAIPALGEWGVLNLGLLLLCGATMVLGRRI